MHFLLLLIRHTRSREERDNLYLMVYESARDRRRQLEEIVMTDAQLLISEGRDEGLKLGRDEGLKLGRDEGLKQGSAAEARQILLRLGTRRFGAPDSQTQIAIEKLANTSAIEQLIDRLLDVSDWNSLFSE
ncbi:MAG TPA: DUF4351 domain-containing protein [Armatimonadota bacterium]|nr:DUF4351 domain-containing protein [Armatimonadota bacterium]